MVEINRFKFIVIFLSFFLMRNVNAAQIDVSGYASLIGTKTNEKDISYWNEYASNYVDFTHRSHIGLQFNTEIVKDLEFSLTLLGSGKNKYNAQTAWFYATYETSESSSFRFGRLKVPFYMISNYIDIGHAYPWVTPPPEVYSTNVIQSVDGFEYIYETNIFNSLFSINTYVGSNDHKHSLSPSYINDPNANIGNKYETGDQINFEAHELFGVVFGLSTDHITFKISHNQAVFSSDDVSISNARMSIGGFGIIIDMSNFILYSEFSHRDTEATLQVILPDQDSKYITLGYRISKFLPFVTYATIDKGKSNSKYALVQESTSLGLRYDVNPKMDIKFEATQTKPGFKAGDIGRYGLFDQEVDTNRTPYVYSMSVDILF